jgi:hypothetical protein
MQAQVKFTTFGANSAFGSFAPGDRLRCSEEMAEHLVNHLKCAEYAEPFPAAAAKTKTPTRKSGKAK